MSDTGERKGLRERLATSIRLNAKESDGARWEFTEAEINTILDDCILPALAPPAPHVHTERCWTEHYGCGDALAADRREGEQADSQTMSEEDLRAYMPPHSKCFTCEGEKGLPATRPVVICEGCYGEDDAQDSYTQFNNELRDYNVADVASAELAAGEQAAPVCTCSENLGCPVHFPNQHEQAAPGLRDWAWCRHLSSGKISGIVSNSRPDFYVAVVRQPNDEQAFLDISDEDAELLLSRAARAVPVPQTARERHDANFLEPESTCFGQPFSECPTAYCAANRPAPTRCKHGVWAADHCYKCESDPESLAQQFHEAYERLAPSFGYQTREASAKPWAEVPENNRKLMIAVCAELLTAQRDRQGQA